MSHRYRFGDFELDLARRELRRRGEQVELQPKVFAVLAVLVQDAGRALGKDDFLERVWSGRFVTENVLSRCIRELRKVLGDSAASPAYIRTLRGHGYQFVATVEAAAAPEQATTRVAVLPFQPLVPGASHPALELGLADTLVNDLSRVRDLVVRPLSVVRDAGAGQALADPLALGRKLDVDVVVEGSLQVADDQVRISTRAVRVSDGTALMAERFEERSTGLFDLQDHLSRSVIEVLADRLIPASRPAMLRGTRSVAAYRAYVDGRLKLARHSVDSVQAGLADFERSLALDQDYLEPLIGIAEASDLLATLGQDPALYHERCRTSAERAIEADPSRARAYTCLGKVAWQHDWQWSQAEALLRRAIELDPGDAEAWIALSDFLCYQRRQDEGLDAAEHAGEINPFSPWIQTLIAQALYMAGRSEEAVAQCRRALELAPDFGFARFFLGMSLAQAGQPCEAVPEIQQAIDQTGRRDFIGALGFALARAGEINKVRALLAEMRTARQGGATVPPIVFAMLEAGLGHQDAALAHLRQVLDQRSWHILLLHADPGFAELRARPEGLALLREVGLPV